MKHERANKPSLGLPFLVEESKGELWDDDEWEAALADPIDPNSLPLRNLSSEPGPTAFERAMRGPTSDGQRAPFDSGEFRLVTKLAVGGMSEVWLADALQGALAGKTIVLKRLLPALRMDAGAVERFRTEGLLGAALAHGAGEGAGPITASRS